MKSTKKMILPIISATIIALSTVAACGCSKPMVSENLPAKPQEHSIPSQDSMQIPDKIPKDDLPSFAPRLRIRLPQPSVLGTYKTEYIHAHNEAADAAKTFDYTLTLSDNNKYTFTANVNGVASSHYGNWYIKRGGALVLFYDEPTETPEHNVYVADSMYAELLPDRKIMFYDSGCTVVLAPESDTSNAH